MYGIEKIKKSVVAAIDLGQKIEEATAEESAGGSKIIWSEGIGIAFSSAMDVLEVGQNAREIKAEYQDLDDEEREELVDFVVSELDLESDDIENVVEKGFDLLVSIDALIDAVKELKQSEE